MDKGQGAKNEEDPQKEMDVSDDKSKKDMMFEYERGML